MSRVVTAVLFAAALTASFAAVSLLGRGGEGHGAPPPTAERLEQAPVGRAAGPSQREPEAAASAQGGDAQAFQREVARAARQEDEKLRQKILATLESDGTTIDEKLDLYRRALREAFEGTPKEALLRYRGAFTQVLLRADSVQQELAALSPGDREAALEHIRREMGFTDEEVAQMEAADAERDARWQSGLAYMQERERIGATFRGEALDEELQQLRERYFGIAARTIAMEEQTGFFRFERPRVYGVN
jgi:hypothetical protein